MASRPRRDASGQIQRSSGNGGGDSLATFLTHDLAPQLKLALPKHLDPDRMTRIALTALRTTPKLAQCDKWSFAACILQAAQLGLEVNTPLGHAWLIPRKNNKRGGVLEATLQIGYTGMIELARRSGQVSAVFAYTVHQGDEFEYHLGLDPGLKHIPNPETDATEKNMTFVYAVARLKGGHDDRQFVVLTKREVDRRRALGQGDTPAWRQHYLAMARKTAIRALFTWLPRSPEMARAQVLDDAEITRQALQSVVDPSIIDQLSGMALPAPDGDDLTEDEVVDPSTGEVPPDQEPSDEDLGRDGTE